MEEKEITLEKSPELSRLQELLAGEEAYVVGGFVRDLLLGQPTRDIDLAVARPALEAGPYLAQALRGKFVPLDPARGIVRIVLPQGEVVDLASLRGDIEQDLEARDFTIDAMAIGLKGGKIIDPWGGRQDLRQGLVRAVREEAFTDDPARLLRAVRLAAELGFSIERDTQQYIQKYAPWIKQVAGERLREELMRLLRLQSYPWLRELDGLGLLLELFPELGVGKGVAQPPEHFWDVFDHSLETVRGVEFLLHQGDGWSEEVLRLVPWSPELEKHFQEEIGGFPRFGLLKLAALLHDIAKPQTKAVEEGRLRFLGHSQLGASKAREIMERLRFSSRETELVETMIYHHLRPAQLGDGGLPTPRAVYRYFRDTGEVGTDTVFLNLADHLAARGPRLVLASWQEHTQVSHYLLQEQQHQLQQAKPARLIDGHDIMRAFELPPGPRLGELLELVREAQAAGEIATREEALALVKGQLAR